MFHAVEYVRSVCRQRKIPIAQLERDCGFANGYLNPKKLSKIPYDRAQKIAAYLNISLNYILTGEEAADPEDEYKISDEIIKAAFFNGEDPTLTKDERDAMWDDARSYMQYKIAQRRQKKANEQ